MITDYDVHPLPSPPLTYPGVGEQFSDPVFGTMCTVFYAGTLFDPINAFYGAGWKYPPFTFEGAFLLGSALFPIDSVTLAPGTPIPYPAIPGGTAERRASQCRPIIFFVSQTGVLYEYAYRTGVLTSRRDFTPWLPKGAVNYQGWGIEGIAADDSVILLIDKAQPSRIIAYDTVADKVVWQRDPVVPFTDYLKPVIDRSGEYVGPFENIGVFAPIADIRTGIEQFYSGLTPDGLAQHNTHGHGWQAQTNGFPQFPNRANLSLIDLTEPRKYQLALMPDNFMPGEGCYIATWNDERWAMAGGFPDPPSKWSNLVNPGQGEIFAFKTDGSARRKDPGSVQRYVHTRAADTYDDTYWQRVHQAVSADGSICAFMTDNLNPNPIDPHQKLWVILFKTGFNAPSYVPRDPPIKDFTYDVRTPIVPNTAWIKAGQQGVAGTQYNGKANADGNGWTAECGLPITFAAASPLDQPPMTIGLDGKYTMPQFTKPCVYHISARVGDLISDPASGLVMSEGIDPNHVTADMIPPPLIPPETGTAFPATGIPPQTTLNPPGEIAGQAPPPPPDPPQPPPAPIPAPPQPPPVPDPPVPVPVPVPLPLPPPPPPAPVITVVTITSDHPKQRYLGIAECVSGDVIQFKANVAPVSWRVSELTGGAVGTITPGGLYQSPSGLTNIASAQVVATAVNGMAAAMNIIINVAPPPPAPPAPQPPVPVPTPTPDPKPAPEPEPVPTPAPPPDPVPVTPPVETPPPIVTPPVVTPPVVTPPVVAPPVVTPPVEQGPGPCPWFTDDEIKALKKLVDIN